MTAERPRLAEPAPLVRGPAGNGSGRAGAAAERSRFPEPVGQPDAGGLTVAIWLRCSRRG